MSEGEKEQRSSIEDEVAEPPRPGSSPGWLKVQGDQVTLFWAGLIAAGLLIVGGLGPWVTFGPFSAAGTEGDGWFLIAAGAASILLLLRLNARGGEPDWIGWLLPVAAAVAAIVVLIDLVEILRADLVGVGWGAWIGAIAGVLLVGISIRLNRPGVHSSLVPVLASLLVAGAGVGIGAATAEETDSGLFADDGAEAEFVESEEPAGPPPPSVIVADQGFTESEGTVSYGAVLENSSSDTTATDVSVTVNLLDSEGTIIATETLQVSRIPPGQPFGVGQATFVEGERVASVEIAAEASNGSDAFEALPEVRQPRIVDGEFGRVARAEILNTLDQPLLSLADMFFVFRDEQGTIVGGAPDFP